MEKRGHIVKYCEDLAAAEAELKQKGKKNKVVNRYTTQILPGPTKDLGKPLEPWKIMS